MTLAVRGAGWISLYLLVALAPLGVVLLGDVPPGRGFLIDFSSAAGFVGLALMGLEFALCARFKAAAAPFGIDTVLQFHRQIGFVALGLLLGHPILLIVVDTDRLRLLNVAEAPMRARIAVTATVAVLVLVVTSVRRQQLRISYEAWQVIHSVLSVVAVVGGLYHAVKIGYYLNEGWKVGVWVAYSAALVALLLWVRFVKPLREYRHPWRVARVEAEADRTCTLVLEPDGHPGLTFAPGQFAWIAVGRSPFSITKHPFSFSSSAERAPHEVALSIKERGDFTRSVKDTPIGTRVYIDGPHGVFTIDRHPGPGFVFIGGGVGITPLLSMLSTLADRGDPRPCLLILANHDASSIPFRPVLDELERRLELTVVHVLRHPDSDWTGESGRVDADLLSRLLTPAHLQHQFFICGVAAMMDSLEEALVVRGVPFEKVHTERFDMV